MTKRISKGFVALLNIISNVLACVQNGAFDSLKVNISCMLSMDAISILIFLQFLLIHTAPSRMYGWMNYSRPLKCLDLKRMNIRFT